MDGAHSDGKSRSTPSPTCSSGTPVVHAPRVLGQCQIESAVGCRGNSLCGLASTWKRPPRKREERKVVRIRGEKRYLMENLCRGYTDRNEYLSLLLLHVLAVRTSIQPLRAYSTTSPFRPSIAYGYREFFVDM